VKTGIFRAILDSPDEKKELATFVAGDSFGELALIDHAPRSRAWRPLLQVSSSNSTTSPFSRS